MKIVILWEQYQAGGVDTHLLTLLKYWPNKEDNFTIIYNIGNKGCLRIKPELLTLSNVKLVQYRSYSYSSLANEFQNTIFSKIIKYVGYIILPITVNIVMRRKLKKILLKLGDVDVVIANNGGYPAAWDCFSVVMAAKAIGVPKRIMLVHHEATKAGYFHEMYEHYMDLKMQGSLTDMITVSFATRNSLISNRWFSTYKLPIRVVHNGITLDKEDASGSGVNICDEFNLHDKIVIGLVGRLERYKGQEDIIIACSELPNAYQDKIIILLIGEGDKAEIRRLSNLASTLGVLDYIIFTGYIEGSSSKIIKQLDLLLMLTKDFEGFGLTLAEAMAVGTPIITTDVGGVREFVSDDVGTIIPPESPIILAEKIKEFIEEPSYYINKADNALTLIEDRFNAELMAKQYRRIMIEPSI